MFSMSGIQKLSAAAVRQVANQLSKELGGYEETGLSENEEGLSQRHQTLIADSFGLLKGLGDGMVNNGQPRIRDNLLQVITELSDSKAASEISLALRSVLSRAASCGLTAESHEVDNLRRKDLTR